MKARELIDDLIDRLTYEDIKGHEGLEYLFHLGGIDVVKKHLRMGHKNVMDLRLTPLRDLRGFLSRGLKRHRLKELPTTLLAAELGLTGKHFRSFVRALAKEKNRDLLSQKENQEKLGFE